MVPVLGWIIEGFDRVARRIAEFTGIQRGFQRAGDRYNPLTTAMSKAWSIVT